MVSVNITVTSNIYNIQNLSATDKNDSFCIQIYQLKYIHVRWKKCEYEKDVKHEFSKYVKYEELQKVTFVKQYHGQKTHRDPCDLDL